MASSEGSDTPTGRTPGLPGRLFEPGASRYQAASLNFRDGLWMITPQEHGQSLVEGHAFVTFDLAVTGVPRKLQFSTGHVFECDDHLGFEQLSAQADGRKAGRPRSLGIGPVQWGLLLVFSLLVPVGLWFLYPVAADSVARSLPTAVDRSIGQSIIVEMDGTLLKPSNLSAPEKRRLQSIFDTVVEASGLSRDRVQLSFRRSTFQALDKNALAFPDGTIVLMDGLVELAESDDELAAVLAHEIGHVKHRHALRKIVRATGVSVLATLLLGESSSLVEEILIVGVGIAELSYSREFEIESDREAAALMRDLGRDPTALISLLRRLDESCGRDCEETGLFSTHPGLQDRLKAVSEGN